MQGQAVKWRHGERFGAVPFGPGRGYYAQKGFIIGSGVVPRLTAQVGATYFPHNQQLKQQSLIEIMIIAL